MKNSNAFTNLKNRYLSVLKKCALLNVFGSLAVATMCASPFMASEALAANNASGDTVISMDATDGSYQTPPNQVSALNDPILNNYGTISGGAHYDIGLAGMYGRGSNNYIFSNFGTIEIDYTAEDDIVTGSAYTNALGMYAFGNGYKTLTNNNTITITARGGTATADADAKAFAQAYGMHAFGNGNNTLTNNDTITVTATGGIASASASASLSATANANAYGMYVSGSGNHLLNNTGIITASATVQMAGASASAFEAYGESSFTVGTWATTLRDWSDNDAVFGLNSGEAITFGEGATGATLILRPSENAQGKHILDKAYYVAKMVSIDGIQQTQFAAGNIEGKIAEVKTEVDYLTANLDNSEPANPKVSLTRTVDSSGNVVADLPMQRLTAQSLSTNLAHLKGVSDVTKNAIANVYNRALGFEEFASNTTNTTKETNTTGLSAGSSAINPWTIFANAYGSYTDNNEYDYNSNSYGFTGGLTHNFTEQFALGGHFNVNIANSDSDNFDSDSTSFAFGAHAQYFINPKWYVNASASFAFGDSEVEYRQPIGTAKDTFSSFSAFTTLASGYVFEINKNNIIVPEIGLSYLHAENDDYLLDFGAGNEIYNFNLHNTSYDNLYADFSVTWQGYYNLASSLLTPSVGVGIRQNLTGSDIDASYDLFNNRYETQVSSDNTTFLVDAGLEWTKNNFSISTKYEGELGSEQQSHSGSVNFKYMF